MNRELILFSRNIIQDSFVKLYFPHDDIHRVVHFEEGAKPHFNWKTIPANAGISHDKDKLISLPSYLYNGNAYTIRTKFLSWDGPCFFVHNLGKWHHWQAHINIYSQVFFFLHILYHQQHPWVACLPVSQSKYWCLPTWPFIFFIKMWSLNTTVITILRLTQLRSNQRK